MPNPLRRRLRNLDLLPSIADATADSLIRIKAMESDLRTLKADVIARSGAETKADIVMTDDEARLFRAFVRCAERYTEFGAGGSTRLAAEYARRIVSVDSSETWLSDVRGAIGGAVALTTHLVDIGETGGWGFPIDESRRDQWPRYSLSVWDNAEAALADVFLIDGRFRVACFAESFRRARPGAILIIHDYASRDYYHSVASLADTIAVADDLCVFLKRDAGKDEEAAALADEHRFDPR